MMNNDFPRLCGGTFFTLVLQALKPRMKAREHYSGNSDGLSDPDAFIMWIRLKITIMEAKKMENKLQPSEPGALQGNSQAATFNLPGDGNTLVAHTDAVNNNYNVVLLNGSQPAGCDIDAGASLEFNPNYCN